ncbi:MAG: hypothetical protein IPP74_11920 [Alphaproteobacteria bacterium]|nr:hypothetical protein [Alphaproteobacteria bacterium]
MGIMDFLKKGGSGSESSQSQSPPAESAHGPSVGMQDSLSDAKSITILSNAEKTLKSAGVLGITNANAFGEGGSLSLETQD